MKQASFFSTITGDFVCFETIIVVNQQFLLKLYSNFILDNVFSIPHYSNIHTNSVKNGAE